MNRTAPASMTLAAAQTLRGVFGVVVGVVGTSAS